MTAVFSLIGIIMSVAYLYESVVAKNYSLDRYKNGYRCAATWSAFWSATILAVGYSESIAKVISEMSK